MTRRSAYGQPLCTWGDACRMVGVFVGPDGQMRCGIHRRREAEETQLTLDVQPVSGTVPGGDHDGDARLRGDAA